MARLAYTNNFLRGETMEHEQTARSIHRTGYNCSSSVFCAFVLRNPPTSTTSMG